MIEMAITADTTRSIPPADSKRKNSLSILTGIIFSPENATLNSILELYEIISSLKQLK